ncbi:MAG: J domain-containing protein, partial [Spirochaetota bacterium]
YYGSAAQKGYGTRPHGAFRSNPRGGFYRQFQNRTNSYRVYPGLGGTDPYRILGVNNGSSMEQIKKAFREKLKKFHPDVAESRGMGTESKRAYEEKTRQICRAYQILGGR